MIPTARSFKQPQSREECNGMTCRECDAMCAFTFFGAESWECFNMVKHKEFRSKLVGTWGL